MIDREKKERGKNPFDGAVIRYLDNSTQQIARLDCIRLDRWSGGEKLLFFFCEWFRSDPLSDSATLTGYIFRRNAIQLRQIDTVAGEPLLPANFRRELWNRQPINRAIIIIIIIIYTTKCRDHKLSWISKHELERTYPPSFPIWNDFIVRERRGENNKQVKYIFKSLNWIEFFR